MKNVMFVLSFAILGLCILNGCATNGKSPVMPPDVRDQISYVSISPDIYAPTKITLPNASLGIVERGIESVIETNFKNKLLEEFDYRKVIADQLTEEFRKQIVARGVFKLAQPEKADAEFVLEVRNIELIAKYSFLADRLRKLTPSIDISVRLIKDPPLDLVESDSGKFEPQAPENHPTLYQETISIRSTKGLPQHLKADYMKESVFKSAFEAAIKQAVTKLMENW
jgi:hypothetical protein